MSDKISYQRLLEGFAQSVDERDKPGWVDPKESVYVGYGWVTVELTGDDLAKFARGEIMEVPVMMGEYVVFVRLAQEKSLIP